MTQYLTEVDPKSEEMIVTARVILAAALKPTAPLNVTAIAIATGLTVDVVRHVLNSPVYQQMLSDELKFLVSGTMTRGVAALDQIINNKDATDANKISAVRTATHVYQAMVSAPRPADDDGDDLQKALDLIEKIGGKKKDASVRRTHPDPEAEQEDRD